MSVSCRYHVIVSSLWRYPKSLGYEGLQLWGSLLGMTILIVLDGQRKRQVATLPHSTVLHLQISSKCAFSLQSLANSSRHKHSYSPQ